GQPEDDEVGVAGLAGKDFRERMAGRVLQDPDLRLHALLLQMEAERALHRAEERRVILREEQEPDRGLAPRGRRREEADQRKRESGVPPKAPPPYVDPPASAEALPLGVGQEEDVPVQRDQRTEQRDEVLRPVRRRRPAQQDRVRLEARETMIPRDPLDLGGDVLTFEQAGEDPATRRGRRVRTTREAPAGR